jgi:tRNA dimethylallyltransferase
MQERKRKYNLLTILGPTASGKTRLASRIAAQIDGEIISADSRQVYRGMDIGTGKDYNDYIVNDVKIPAHLIDIEDAGKHYNVCCFQSDFIKVFKDIRSRNRFPLMCGGTGLYLEAVLKDYKLIHVPPNKELRKELELKTKKELIDILSQLKPKLHNKTDIETRRRAIRAIEIELYYRDNPQLDIHMPEINSMNIGVKFDRDNRRQRITERLKQRLEEGMLEEVRQLLDSGLTPRQLIYYGLEYKYLTFYLIGELSYREMFEKLEIAIHQFAKRQMTWFRGMEKRGTKIHWIDGNMPMNEKIEKVLDLLTN